MFQPAAFKALATASSSLISVRNRAPLWPAGISSASSGSISCAPASMASAFGIAIGVGVGGFDDAEMIEEKGDAAGLAERTGLENVADFGGGAVAIIGQAFHDDRHFVRREAFVSDEFKNDFFLSQARAFFDGALDGVAGDGAFAGLFNGGGEAGIENPGPRRRVWRRP